MRIIALVLVILIVLVQYPLWLGKGGWFRLLDYRNELEAQDTINKRLSERNLALEGEILDIKSYDYNTIEARARKELNMVKKNEVFFQVLERN